MILYDTINHEYQQIVSLTNKFQTVYCYKFVG